MKKLTKKIISLLMVSSMLLSSVTATAAPKEAEPDMTISFEQANTVYSSFENIIEWINEVYKKQQEIKESEVIVKMRQVKNEVKEIKLSLNPIKSVPLYNQQDYPNTPYGDYGTVASHGCGITSLAMVSTYLLNKEMLPDELAEQFGNYNTEKGSMWILFEDSAEQLGLKLQERTYDTNTVIEALKNGQVVIALQGQGLFTASGHFIVLVGLTADGKIIVHDPNGDNYTKNDILTEGFANGFTEEQVFNVGGPYWVYQKKDMPQNDIVAIVAEK